MLGEPPAGQVDRRRQAEDVAVGAPAQVGQGGLAADQHRAGVDLVHQVEALGLQLLHPDQADRPGVVDQRVDPAEAFGGAGHGRRHGLLVAHVELQRQGLAAGGLDLGGDAEDGAFQLGMRLGALRRDHQVGAIARGAQGYLPADAAAGAGDEQGLAVQ